MTILLAGDIGGTKTILRLVESQPTAVARQTVSQTQLYEQIFPSQEYPDLVPLVQEFLLNVSEQLGQPPTIARACFGIAGPVTNRTSELTNLRWSLSEDRLERELRIPSVSLINDFAAVGYGVLGLTEEDILTLQAAEPQPMAPIAIIGAGTGLGEAFLIPESNGYRVFGTEGGHADFAPSSDLEFQLMRYLLERHNIDRVSVERVVSGQGVVAIYQFLRDRGLFKEHPDIAEIFHVWEREIGREEKTVDPAAVISQAAIAQSDPLSERTMKLFISAYGAEAGNLALKLLPYGGLYVSGGIAAKNLALIQRGEFMQAFLQKGRVSHLLKRVPVHVVLNPRVGLIGASLYAAQMQ